MGMTVCHGKKLIHLLRMGIIQNLFFGAAKLFWGVDGMTNSVFKAMDRNDNKIVTLEECDLYAQETCNVTLKDIWNLTVAEVCEILDKTPQKKNKKESQ